MKYRDYYHLLEVTQKRKEAFRRKYLAPLAGKNLDLGQMLALEELRRNPGGLQRIFVGWFLDELVNNCGDFIEQEGIDGPNAKEIYDITMAYEHDDPDLYDLLPVEAKLYED